MTAHKQVLFRSAAREKILRGTAQLADAVRVTLQFSFGTCRTGGLCATDILILRCCRSRLVCRK